MARTPYDGNAPSSWQAFTQATGFRLDQPSRAVRNALKARQIVMQLSAEDRRTAIALLRNLRDARKRN
jgi:hypothetical protein